jgi:hypothetical protein
LLALREKFGSEPRVDLVDTLSTVLLTRVEALCLAMGGKREVYNGLASFFVYFALVRREAVADRRKGEEALVSQAGCEYIFRRAVVRALEDSRAVVVGLGLGESKGEALSRDVKLRRRGHLLFVMYLPS